MKEWVSNFTSIITIIGVFFIIFGFINMASLFKPYISPIQDLEIHNFKDSGVDFDLTVEAYLKPDYNILYSFVKIPVDLKISLDHPHNCPKDIEENGFSFWFFYEKINGSGSGGSIVSYDPINFYNISIKPGETKTMEGWVKFTGEGEFVHGLNDAKNHIRLKSNQKSFLVYPVYLHQQIENSNIIVSFSIITGGLSFIMVAFIIYQRYDKFDIEKKQNSNFKKVLNELKEINSYMKDKDKRFNRKKEKSGKKYIKKGKNVKKRK